MKRTTQRFSAVLLSLLLLGGAHGLWAQTTNANISGVVTDATGAAIVNASIQVKNVATGVIRQTISDGQGRYIVPDLIVGEYEVQASQTGFQTVVRKGITLTVGSQSVVDITLPVGQQQQTVSVEGGVSQVDVVSSAISSTVETKQMNDLPLNGRNLTDLVALAPGVQAGYTVGNARASVMYGLQQSFSVAGARPEGQAYLLDNANIQGFWNRGSGSEILGTTLGVEAIAEFSLLTNTYSAQFGGAGAVVNAVSKSGTNSFHGSAFEYLRNSALDARNFFDGGTKPPFRQNQFGGSLGGPIKKDKLFFFVNYEGLRNALGQTMIATVPDANAHNGIIPINGVLTNVGVSPKIAAILAMYPLPQFNIKGGVGQIAEVGSLPGQENYALMRGDWTISASDSLFVRYVMDRADLTQPFAGSWIEPRFPEVSKNRNHYATIEERHLISPTIVNLARVTFVRIPTIDVLANPLAAPALNFFPERGQDGSVTVGGLSSLGPSIFPPNLQLQNKFNEADDVYWTVGPHSIKFGGYIERIQTNIDPYGWYGGQYQFTSLQSFLQGNPFLFFGPQPGKTDPYRDIREIDVTGYIQDDWKATSRLTVNLGLRYSFVTNPVTQKHPLSTLANPPFGTIQQVPNVFASNPSLRNWDPRVGMAWDPFKDHKTSIRAGFGIFHNVIQARTYESGYVYTPPYALNIIVFPQFPNPFINGLPAPSQIVAVDYHTDRTPYTIQWNMNVQRELMANTVLTVGYVGSRGVNLFANRDLNPVLPTVLPNGVWSFGHANPGSIGIAQNPRVNTKLSSFGSAGPVADSNYNSLQVGLNRRLSNNLQAQLSYTWSRCMDNASGTSGLEGAVPWTNPLVPSFDRGRCNFDRAQTAKLSGLYTLPFKSNLLVRGWQVGAIFTGESGSPYDVRIGFDQSGNQTGNQRPNIIRSAGTVITGSVNQWVDPTAFALPAPGTLGNLQRNLIDGPGLINFDFSVLKDTPVTRISEQFRVQFRAEFFNIFNHANFALPNSNLFLQGAGGTGTLNPTFSQITSTLTSSRQIQFALKLIF